MPRPPMAIGSFGEFHRSAWVDGHWVSLHAVPAAVKPTKYRSSARYRAHDGKVRPMERVGPTSKRADEALKKSLVERLNSDTTALTADSRFHEVAELWINRIQKENVGTTYDRYRGRLDNHVLPAFGELYIRECTPARFKRALDAMRDAGLSAPTRRGIRTVISGVMQEAVDLEIITSNPAKNIARIKGGKGQKKKIAYDANTLTDFLARVDGDRIARRGDVPDLIRFIFGTGCRFGEALAVRWSDLNLAGSAVMRLDEDDDQVEIPANGLWINGNIVAVSGQGVVRHEGKTFAARRTMTLPDYLVTLLLVRRPAGARETDPVFPSATGGWRHPSNVQRSVRSLRARIGYPKFTLYVGRKSVATQLDKAGFSAREIAAILGHAKPSMTQDVYMAKDGANPAAAAALDRLHRAS